MYSFILTLVFIAVNLASVHATPKNDLKEITKLLELTAHTLNLESLNLKQIKEIERFNRNPDDRSYLRSFMGKPILPSGYKALALVDRVLFIMNGRIEGSMQIESLEPLKLNIDGKKIKINPSKIRESLKYQKVVDASVSNSWFTGLVQIFAVPAYAEVDSIISKAAPNSTFFLSVLRNSSLNHNFDDSILGPIESVNIADLDQVMRNALSDLSLDNQVRCKDGVADFKVGYKETGTNVPRVYLTVHHTGLWCSAEIPDHKRFLSNQSKLATGAISEGSVKQDSNDDGIIDSETDIEACLKSYSDGRAKKIAREKLKRNYIGLIYIGQALNRCCGDNSCRGAITNPNNGALVPVEEFNGGTSATE